MTDPLKKETPLAMEYANEIMTFLNDKFKDQEDPDGYAVLKALVLVSRNILKQGGSKAQVDMLLTPYEVSLECFKNEKADK